MCIFINANEIQRVKEDETKSNLRATYHPTQLEAILDTFPDNAYIVSLKPLRLKMDNTIVLQINAASSQANSIQYSSHHLQSRLKNDQVLNL